MPTAPHPTDAPDSSARNTAGGHVTTPDYGTTWVLHLQPEGALLVEKDSLFYVRLSRVAAELLLQLSRTTTFDRTVAVRSVLDNESRAEITRRLRPLLDGHPLTSQWLDGAVNSDIRISGSPDVYIPMAIALQLTNACNLTCPFCYASSGDRRRDELTADEWIAVLQRFASRGTLSATLTGGEPTLAPGFRAVLAAASGLMHTTAVFTNGYAWSDTMIDFVADLGNVDIQISVDGSRVNHDAIRGGHRAFDRAMETITKFASRGVAVDVAMTATPRTFTDVYAVAAAVGAAGARLLRVGQVQSVGRADGSDGFGLTSEQRAAVSAQLERYQSEGHPLEVLPWSACDSIEDTLRRTGLSTEFLVPGYLSWYILSDGRVTPCQLEERSILGDIRSEHIDDLATATRLRDVQAGVYGCHCMRRVRTPSTADLPYSGS